MGDRGLFYNVFWVDEPVGGRWAAAIELLREGHVVVFRGVGLSLREQGLVVVDVPSWYRVEDMPRASATDALLNGEAAAANLIQDDAAFAALVSGRAIEVRLLDDWSGLLATRREGVTKFHERWSSRHPQSSAGQ